MAEVGGGVAVKLELLSLLRGREKPRPQDQAARKGKR